MRLNRRQPFATITGHEWARFEQNGILFDTTGATQDSDAVIENAAKPTKPGKPAIKLSTSELKLNSAKEFLRTLLAGGPMDKSVVFKEAENNCQDWENIKLAFSQLNGVNFKHGPSTLWRLNAETI